MLETGERIKLLDPRLDIMTGDLLPPVDARQINVLDDRLVRVDHHSWVVAAEINTKITLGYQYRQPQPAFSDDLVLRGPDLAHRRGGVPVGQDIADRHCLAHHQPRSCSCNIAAIKRTVELDFPNRLVRPAASFFDILTESDDCEHAAAGADQVPLRIGGCPGMDDHA